MVEEEDVIVAMISEVNLLTNTTYGIVDIEPSWQFCDNKDLLREYEEGPMVNKSLSETLVAHQCWVKEKVILTLNSNKTLVLNKVFLSLPFIEI